MSIEFLIKRTDGEWFDLHRDLFKDVLRPKSFASCPVEGWGDHRIKIEAKFASRLRILEFKSALTTAVCPLRRPGTSWMKSPPASPKPPAKRRRSWSCSMGIKQIQAPGFDRLKASVESHTRLAGYYIINLVDIAELRASGETQERIAEEVFQFFDNHPWPPQEQRPQDQLWSDYTVDRVAARRETVEALVAGHSRGHLKPTIEPEIADGFFQRFDSFFTEPKEYYVRMGLGNQEYVFLNGVVIIDQNRAGILWVVEGD